MEIQDYYVIAPKQVEINKRGIILKVSDREEYRISYETIESLDFIGYDKERKRRVKMAPSEIMDNTDGYLIVQKINLVRCDIFMFRSDIQAGRLYGLLNKRIGHF